MEKQFYAKCLIPTQTITKGKEYKIIAEENGLLTILNDHNNQINLKRFRFGKLMLQDIDENEILIKCINEGAFKGITKNKLYPLVKKTKDFFFIVNNIGITTRYGKKYFKLHIVEKKPPEKVLKAFCIYPIKDELEFKKAYDFKEHIEKDLITLTNEQGVVANYLKKRFKFEKV